MKKINYVSGQKVNNHGICYISDVQPFIGKTGRSRRACLFKCKCGNTFISNLQDVIGNKRTSCGCKKGVSIKIYKEGDFINGIKFIKTCGTVNNAQRAIFECPICKNHWESSVGNIQGGNTKSCCSIKRGWSRSQWIKLSNVAKLYKIKLFNENESFIKIGITTTSISKRFQSIPYRYEILKVIEGDSGYIFDLENKIKKLFKKHRYTPLIKFKGETECYKI